MPKHPLDVNNEWHTDPVRSCPTKSSGNLALAFWQFFVYLPYSMPSLKGSGELRKDN